MAKWTSLSKKGPRVCETILFSDGKTIYIGWLETYEPLEDPVFYAVTDGDGKPQYRLDTYWPENIQWWMPFPKLPKIPEEE